MKSLHKMTVNRGRKGTWPWVEQGCLHFLGDSPEHPQLCTQTVIPTKSHTSEFTGSPSRLQLINALLSALLSFWLLLKYEKMTCSVMAVGWWVTHRKFLYELRVKQWSQLCSLFCGAGAHYQTFRMTLSQMNCMQLCKHLLCTEGIILIPNLKLQKSGYVYINRCGWMHALCIFSRAGARGAHLPAHSWATYS